MTWQPVSHRRLLPVCQCMPVHANLSTSPLPSPVFWKKKKGGKVGLGLTLWCSRWFGVAHKKRICLERDTGKRARTGDKDGLRQILGDRATCAPHSSRAGEAALWRKGVRLILARSTALVKVASLRYRSRVRSSELRWARFSPSQSHGRRGQSYPNQSFSYGSSEHFHEFRHMFRGNDRRGLCRIWRGLRSG